MNKIESVVLSKTIHYIINYIKIQEKTPIIEPLACMIHLGILSFKKNGTKICIYDN
jgi:hypothetical protein